MTGGKGFEDLSKIVMASTRVYTNAWDSIPMSIFIIIFKTYAHMIALIFVHVNA